MDVGEGASPTSGEFTAPNQLTSETEITLGDCAGAGVSLRNVTKRYESVTAVDDLNLEVAPGELLTLLGTSGSGKTTTLMMIAGFTEPTTGEVSIGGRPVTHVPAHRRNIGVVFQHYALFPHMTVAENVAFPLHMRGIARAEIRTRVQAALDLVQLGSLTARFPNQLSGGQQQRVAFARAVVFNPPLLLLDEPLGALDKKLRESMQLELKELHGKLKTTMIYVTHDQTEALVLSDHVAVMTEGRIEQIGTPQDIYDCPTSALVADFVGDSNIFNARVQLVNGRNCTLLSQGGNTIVAQLQQSIAVGEKVRLMVRPERIVLGSESFNCQNRLVGVVKELIYLGECSKYLLLAGNERFAARRQNLSSDPVAAVGDEISFGFRATDVAVFPD